MTCPDENVFAQIQAGLLDAAEMAQFHRHLDECAVCLELAGILGCLHDDDLELDAPNLSKYLKRTSTPSERVFRSSRPQVATSAHGGRQILLVSHGVMLLTHAYSSFIVLPVFWLAFRASVSFTGGHFGIWSVHMVWLPYVLIWGSLGPMLACLILLGMLTPSRWARPAARLYAVVSLPTLFLVPLAICLLFVTRPRQIGG